MSPLLRASMRPLFALVAVGVVPRGTLPARPRADAQDRRTPSQATAPVDTAAIARRLMAGAKYATLVTLDERGAPRTRTVQPRAPEDDFTVWMATNPRTRKVRELARDPRVVLHYFDPVREGYVSVVGRARIVHDRTTKEAHWDPAWSAFYPDRDAGVVLIAVTPSVLEIVSERDHLTGDQATWRPPTWRPTRSRPTR